MRVSVSSDVFTKSLALASRVVPTLSPIPAFSNVLLKAERGQLRLTAANDEFGVTIRLDDVSVEADGSVAVPAHLLTEFVGSLPPEQVDMELKQRPQVLRVRCGPYETRIWGSDADEFFVIPPFEGAPSVTVPASSLRTAIKQVIFAVATDETRPALTGVYIQFEGERLRLVATDRFRLALRSIPLAEPSDLNIGVIVPARALHELGRIIGAVRRGEEDSVQITVAEARNRIMFHLPNVDLFSRLVEAHFPDYAKIIPTTCQTRAVVNTDALLQAVRVASLFADDVNCTVRIHFASNGNGTGQITVSAAGAKTGAVTVAFEAAVEGPPFSAAFNGSFVAEALKVVNTVNTVFEATTPFRPGVFRPEEDDEHVHVIMPIDDRTGRK